MYLREKRKKKTTNSAVKIFEYTGEYLSYPTEPPLWFYVKVNWNWYDWIDEKSINYYDSD